MKKHRVSLLAVALTSTTPLAVASETDRDTCSVSQVTVVTDSVAAIAVQCETSSDGLRSYWFTSSRDEVQSLATAALLTEKNVKIKYESDSSMNPSGCGSTCRLGYRIYLQR